MRCTHKDQIEDTKDQLKETRGHALSSILPFLFEFFFAIRLYMSFHFNDLGQWLHFLQESLSAFLQFHLRKQHEGQLVVKEPSSSG